MSDLLLTTKLYVPRPHPNLVSRPQLIDHLDQGLRPGNKLILVSAPAGSGKTTLVSEWVARRRDIPVTWVSLDEGDNDPARFWSYVIAGLQRACFERTGAETKLGQAALAALRSSRPLPIASILTYLINELAEEPAVAGGGLLVLDDFHRVDGSAVHTALTFLLERMPPQIHLVLITRADPPLPLSRLRGRGQMVELRIVDLRFTEDEAFTFLNRTMGLDLSKEAVAALETRTEGWIVGLQMAALALQKQDPGPAGDPIFGFTGQHHYVLDYLADEVLLRQPEEIQAFLQRTAVLDRLTGPLCDAVLERRDSQEVLARLDAANLFVVPLDDERRWYRYHHLFADLLRKRLLQNRPGEVPNLHRRASRWYAENRVIAQAVFHALAADDVDLAASLIEGNALAMMDHGEVTTLLAWLNELPTAASRRRPWLCIARAWVLAYSGRLGAIEPLLVTAERAMANLDGATIEPQSITGHGAAIRAYVATLRGDYRWTADHARQALAHLPKDELRTRAFVASQLSFALRTTDGLAAATQAAVEACDLSLAAGDSHVAVMALCDLAGLQGLQGRLHEAADTYREAGRLAETYARRRGRQLPVVGYVYGRLSTLQRGWNDLDAAVRSARRGVALCRPWGWTEPLVDCCMYLALALQAAGDGQGALDAIREARQAADYLSPWYVSLVEQREVSIRLKQGDLASASRWALAQEERLSVGQVPDSQYAFRYVAMVRVFIALSWTEWGGEDHPLGPVWRERLERTLPPLAELHRAAEEGGNVARTIQVQICQALVLQALGRIEDALRILGRALVVTEPIGQVRCYVDRGAPMESLLRKAARRGIAVDCVGGLLAAFKRESQPVSLLIEPLTERELDVLRLVAVGLSNREVAAELSLALGTVKRHTSNIYGKLNVHRRTQAVARGRDLGLL